MDLYPIAFFIHMMGLISVFGGQIILQHGGARLRAASDWHDVRQWLGLLSIVRGMSLGGTVMLFLSGLYMAWNRWTFAMPWVSIGLAVVIVFPIIGARVIGAGFARIGKEAAGAQGPLDDASRARLLAPQLWAPAFAMNFALVGVVWLMGAKPGWIGSVAIPVVAAAIGAFIGANVARRAPARPAASR